MDCFPFIFLATASFLLPGFYQHFGHVLQRWGMLQLSVHTVQVSRHQAPVFTRHPRDSHTSPAWHRRSSAGCALQWFLQPGWFFLQEERIFREAHHWVSSVFLLLTCVVYSRVLFLPDQSQSNSDWWQTRMMICLKLCVALGGGL